MFDFKNKSKTKLSAEEVEVPQEKEQLISSPRTTSYMADVSDTRVHVMPEKFLVSGERKAVSQTTGLGGKRKMTGMKKNVITGVIIGVVVLGMLSLAAWFLIKSIEGPQQKDLLVNQNINKEPDLSEDEGILRRSDEVGTPQDKISEPKCSPENCRLCSEQECLNLSDVCHLEDLCLLRGYESEESCPDYICVAGPAEVETPEEEELAIGELTMSRDSDFDLLTDIEEGIWGTDPLKSDSDGDGYNDGTEIINLYNPNLDGVGTGKLVESDLIKTFTNTQYGYSVYYPSSWQQSESRTDAGNVMFVSNTGEFIGIIVEENYAGFLAAKEWYLSQNPSVTEEDLEEVLIGNWSGVKSPDKLNVYLVNNNYIYTLTYNIGLKQELNYKTTFEMMLKSFRLFESPL